MNLTWSTAARGMLEPVPSPLCQYAATGTGDCAREHGRDDVIAAAAEEFRKEPGMWVGSEFGAV